MCIIETIKITSHVLYCPPLGYNRVQIWPRNLCSSTSSFSCDLCSTWWKCDFGSTKDRFNGKGRESCCSWKILRQWNKVPYATIREICDRWTTGILVFPHLLSQWQFIDVHLIKKMSRKLAFIWNCHSDYNVLSWKIAFIWNFYYIVLSCC